MTAINGAEIVRDYQTINSQVIADGPAYFYRYESPIGETEPSGLQAAARLAGEQNRKVAELIRACVDLAGHNKILEDIAGQWLRGDTATQVLRDSACARAEVLSKVRELSRAVLGLGVVPTTQPEYRMLEAAIHLAKGNQP